MPSRSRSGCEPKPVPLFDARVDGFLIRSSIPDRDPPNVIETFCERSCLRLWSGENGRRRGSVDHRDRWSGHRLLVELRVTPLRRSAATKRRLMSKNRPHELSIFVILEIVGEVGLDSMGYFLCGRPCSLHLHGSQCGGMRMGFHTPFGQVTF